MAKYAELREEDESKDNGRHGNNDESDFENVNEMHEVDLSQGSGRIETGYKPCPETSSWWISRACWEWASPLVKLGAKKPLHEEDLGEIPFTSQYDYNQSFFLESVYGVSDPNLIPNKPKRSLVISLLAFSKRAIIQSSILKVFASISRFLSPLILTLILKIIASLILFEQKDRDLLSPEEKEENNQTIYYGVFLSVVLFLNSILKTGTEQYQYWQGLKDSLKMRNALMAAIYRKTLVLSSKGRQSSTVGQMMNLISVDVNMVMDWLWHSAEGMASVLVIVLSLFLIAELMGWIISMVVMACLVLQIPLNAGVAKIWSKFGKEVIEKSDGRIGATNELLYCMRFVKIYNWEKAMKGKVDKFRENETRVIRNILRLRSFGNFLWSFTPSFISISIFITFVWRGGYLTAPVAFATIALITALREPIAFLGQHITVAVAAYIAVNRISAFLSLEEVDAIEQSVDEVSAVRINNASFSWDLSNDQPTLRNINFQVKHKELVGVVGPVGSGKSSLASAIIGDIKKVSGGLSLWGKTAFTSQQAWIMNATVKDNILFGKEYDKNRYEAVVRCCALQHDFEQFSEGDASELGEKGINLSGGQKQRLSLARAVYQDADIYVFDEPLGAVDSSVAKWIFEECITKFLKDKTRVLITHQLQFLPLVDSVVVMNEGEIKHHGTFDQLMNSGVDLSSIIQAHSGKLNSVSGDKKDEGEEIEVEVEEEGEGGSEEVEIKIEEKKKEKKVGDKEKGKIIVKEERETGAVNPHIFKEYFTVASHTPLLMILVVVCFVLSQLTKILSDYSLALWAEKNEMNEGNIEEGQEEQTLAATSHKYLVIYIAWTLVHLFFIGGRELLLAFTLLRMSKAVHDKMLNCMLRAKMAFFDATPTGRIINRFSKDLMVLDRQLFDTISDVTHCTTSVLGMFMVICAFCPLLIPGVLVAFVCYFVLQQYYIKTGRELKRMESLSRSPMYHFYSECVQGASIMRGYGTGEMFLREKFVPAMMANTRIYYWHFAVNRWLAARLDTTTSVVMLMASLYAIYFPSDESGLALSYSLGITGALNWAVRQISQLEVDMNAAERTLSYTTIEPEAPQERNEDSNNERWPTSGEIELDDFWFKYESMKEGVQEKEEDYFNRSQLEAKEDSFILKGISCKIKSREKIGIVGRTGAGKSSLVTALFRLNEASWGTINVDRVPICSLGLSKLRSNISIIPQDPILFHETLRWNLDPFQQFSDAKIWDALEQSNIKRIIAELPNRLDTIVAENGDNFSVGQKQLLCLARALLRQTKILVLDEASASLDLETDEFIQATVRKAFADSTVLTIAHRMHTIIDSDRIMVLDSGKLVEMDSPSNLMQNPNSKFTQLVNHALSANSYQRKKK
eukprot:TRINITY_DN5489_c0_g2_i1.p1 TRINITY_DN5489_c0_g2~~TRINITY_DN5489_c0_g2_i1.p1  ORF type:complete len:1368 (+),score=525.16 TRINITY_DN5489_c0_g2_i1:158-4261(+)